MSKYQESYQVRVRSNVSGGEGKKTEKGTKRKKERRRKKEREKEGKNKERRKERRERKNIGAYLQFGKISDSPKM